MSKSRFSTLSLITIFFAFCSPGSGSPGAGVKGVVLDTTCYGPCVVGAQPNPYTGDAVRLVIRDNRTDAIVGRPKLSMGHFVMPLRPGVYRVKAFFKADGTINDMCWKGEVKRVRVVAGAYAQIQLHVGNTCIL